MGLFDGVTSMLDDVFGSEVTVTPEGGAARVERLVFREGPFVVENDGVSFTTVLPTLSGDRRKIADLVDGGTVDPGNGKIYRCLSALPSGSPAEDARLTIELECIDASA